MRAREQGLKRTEKHPSNLIRVIPAQGRNIKVGFLAVRPESNCGGGEDDVFGAVIAARREHAWKAGALNGFDI